MRATGRSWTFAAAAKAGRIWAMSCPPRFMSSSLRVALSTSTSNCALSASIPVPQPVTLRTLEKGALLAAVFEPDHLPALGFEHAGNLHHLPLWGNVVQTLTVDIDNPPQITQAVGTGFAQGFWYVAFVKLGIAHQ